MVGGLAYKGTPLKGHPLIKDMPLKGYFSLGPKSVILVLYIKDILKEINSLVVSA